jgi:5-methylthioadenosine/S-adenosylhomocysteine deaminase
MGTRLGAQALHIGDQTGSLAAGKCADLILLDISRLHNSPRFTRDPRAIYAQVIYTSKASDVTDVMINGQWVMRDQILLTLDETAILRSSQEYARKIDQFLIQREESVLSKLVAIGGAMQEESFEVQAKVRITDPAPILAALSKPQIEIIRQRHYHQFDMYFTFDDPHQGMLRYREDEFINEKLEVDSVRSRLTLIGPAFERRFPQEVLLSRSRYLAQATHSLRFYREYFHPKQEFEIQKDRLRYMVKYRGVEFYINIDQVKQPALGYFLEVKSRTWSRRDAEEKSGMVVELITLLDASPTETISQDYFEMVLPG